MKASSTIQVLFIQGGGEGGYRADQAMVESLRGLLGSQYQVYYPELRSEESEPDYGFCKQITTQLSKINAPLILMGHSFGASMILKWLTQYQSTKIIEGVFLLATPFWSGDEHWVQGLKLSDDFASELDPVLPIYFYHCADDREVSVSHMDDYKKGLPHAIFRVLIDGGHQFNNDLPMVVADVKSLMQPK